MDLEKLICNFSEEIIPFLTSKDLQALSKTSKLLNDVVDCSNLLKSSFKEITDFLKKSKGKETKSKQSKFGYALNSSEISI